MEVKNWDPFLESYANLKKYADGVTQLLEHALELLKDVDTYAYKSFATEYQEILNVKD